MKTQHKFSIIFTAVLILSLVFAGSALAKSPNKMVICHNNGNGSYALEKIKTNTLQAHLAHGDAVPGSAVPGQAGKVFSANCAVLSPSFTTQAGNNPITPTNSHGNKADNHGKIADSHGKKADKVNVCHRRGNETFIMINISRNALPAHLAHGDGLPDGVVPGQPHSKFTADCLINEIPQKELVETLTVPSTAEIAVGTTSLVDGQLYEFKAIGTYIFDNPNNHWADAEWLFTGTDIIKGDNWPPHPANVLDLTINGCANNTDWGDYQDTHIYTLPWTGDGTQVTFTICDTEYSDNSGSLTVEIWKINWLP